MIREWAEVPYVPAQGYEKKDSRPYRYLAVRVRRQQEELFDDGTQVRHYAVVTNLWDSVGSSAPGVAARQSRHDRADTPHTGERSGSRGVSQCQAWSKCRMAKATSHHP